MADLRALRDTIAFRITKVTYRCIIQAFISMSKNGMYIIIPFPLGRLSQIIIVMLNKAKFHASSYISGKTETCSGIGLVLWIMFNWSPISEREQSDSITSVIASLKRAMSMSGAGSLLKTISIGYGSWHFSFASIFISIWNCFWSLINSKSCCSC